MAKSSKKQCRKPKPHRQGGGLVVVSAQNLRSAKPTSAPNPPGRKGKGKRKKEGGVLGDLTAASDGAESDEDFRHPSTDPQQSNTLSQGSGVRRYLFCSPHSREQRLYYLLATRPTTTTSEAADAGCAALVSEGGCHALVFVETFAGAQELLATLKTLNLGAFAVHERTPKAQAQDYAKRFSSSSSKERGSVLILANAAVARSPPIVPIPKAKGHLVRVVHFDAPEGPKNAAARGRVAAALLRERGTEIAQEVHLDGGGDAAGLMPFTFESAAMSGIHSRLAVAKKLARAMAMSAGEEEERNMRRVAAAAGLEWDGCGGQSESAADAIKLEKRQAHATQATALREKLRVLLCQQLLPAAAAQGTTAASPPNVQTSSKELRKKMTVLGMIRGPQGASTSTKVAPEDRAAAETRWLDCAAGATFGGSWDGSIRTGASCDSVSLNIRSRLVEAKGAKPGCNDGSASGERERLRMAKAFVKWKPNPDTPDPDRWGGQWGKPCGHNEVVLQYLRPFAPMEVVNTRVCSKTSPAPGNSGFDGCLELLSLTCQAHRRALTVWDDASFLHIDKAGVCSSLPKQAMLHLSLPSLRFLVKNMKSFTICSEGQQPPRAVARAAILAACWGAKQARFGPLSEDLSTRVMSFVLSGDLLSWRSAATSFGLGMTRQAAARGNEKRGMVAFASKKRRKKFNL